MPDGHQDRALRPAMLVRAEDIQQQLQGLTGRDLQLWSIAILVMLVLTAGLLALLAPHLLWTEKVIGVQRNYLPQLFFGLVALVVLFNVYILGQKRTMNATRGALIAQLVLNERLEGLSLIDPLTQLFNHRAVGELIPREVARGNQLGHPLSFMRVDVDGFQEISAKHGQREGDHLVTDFAKMLKMTFRGGDVIFRNSTDQFLVALPDTSEEQADFPIQRLLRAVEQWNLSSKADYEMSFRWAVSAYIPGRDYADCLRAVDRKMYQKKNKLVPVF